MSVNSESTNSLEVLRFAMVLVRRDYEKMLQKFIKDNCSAAIHFTTGRMDATDKFINLLEDLINNEK